MNNKVGYLTDEQLAKIIRALQKEIALLKLEINAKQLYLQELIKKTENK